MSVKNFDGFYLDHAASTEDRTTNKTVCIANSHSLEHKLGLEVARQIKDAEGYILKVINGCNGRILWTGSGSQANNLAIQSICVDKELITSAIEHKSILQHTDRIVSAVMPNGCGKVPIIDIVDTLNNHPSTRLISLQMINNETGICQQVAELGQFLKRKHKDVYLHTDAVQALGKLPIDVELMGVDLLTFSAHKFYGPKGLGGLWVSERCFHNLENRFPYLGTLPSEAIIKFASLMYDVDIQKVADYLAVKEHRIIHWFDTCGLEYHQTATHDKIPGILSLCFPGVEAIELALELSDKGVYVSTGSACNSSSTKPSYVLKAMGVPEEQIVSTIHVSVGHAVTPDQCHQAARIISETVKELRNGSQSKYHHPRE